MPAFSSVISFSEFNAHRVPVRRFRHTRPATRAGVGKFASEMPPA